MTKKTTLPAKLSQAVKNSNLTDLTKAEKIASGYAPFMKQVTDQMQLIKKLKKGNKEDTERAKRIRLDLGKICSAANLQKKTDKDYLLLETRFIDSLFNTVNNAARITQEEAKEIETYFDMLEAEKIKKLLIERTALLQKFLFEDDPIPDFIGNMTEDVWNNYFTGAKTNYKQRIEAAERLAAATLEAENLKKLHTERYLLVLPLLSFDQNFDASNLAILSEEQFNISLNNLKQLKVNHEKKQEEIRLENIKLQEEAKAAEKLRLKNKAILEAERVKADKIAKQLQLIEAEKAKKLYDAEKAKQTELSKDDAEKMKDVINILSDIINNYSFKSKEYTTLFNSVVILITKTIKFINSKTS